MNWINILSIQLINILNQVQHFLMERFWPGMIYTSRRIVPNTVTNASYLTQSNVVGAGSFEGCTTLTSIIIPEGKTTIGLDAFKGCTALKSVYIPNSVTDIWAAFKNCTVLESIQFGGTVAEWNAAAVSSIAYMTSLKTIICSDGTVTLS